MLTFIQAAIVGALIWLGFAPAQLWIAPFVALALLFHLLADKTFLKRLSLSFLSGFTFFLLLLHWSSTYVGAAPWLILALGQAALFSLLGILPIRKSVWGALTFAAGFVFIELIRMKLPFGGFGWGRIGFTQIDMTPGLYSWVGVTGVSLFIALSSLVTISSKTRLAFVAMILIALFTPQFTLNHTSQLRIVAIQGGVDSLGLDFNDRAMSVLNRHISQTRGVSHVDLIIWPENASDVDPIRNSAAKTSISQLIRKVQIPIVLGAVETSHGGPLNTSLYYDATGTMRSRYVKQDLAPFGEYIPLRKLAEGISKYAQDVHDFQPGTSWVKHSVNNIPFQSIICFEILDDDHIRAGARETGFLVAQTNNATFGKSAEASQQLQITRARAAELGREFAVVSTTGFTAHVDASGHIREKAPQFESTALKMDIGAADPKEQTPASKVSSGVWFGFLGLILTITAGLNRR